MFVFQLLGYSQLFVYVINVPLERFTAELFSKLFLLADVTEISTVEFALAMIKSLVVVEPDFSEPVKVTSHFLIGFVVLKARSIFFSYYF